MTSRNPQSID